MIKKISILVVLFLTQITFAQKAQKVGYIDSEYILENVPEYKTAQSKLDSKINNWNTSLNKLKSNIETMKLTLSNERPLLTSDLIAEREEDISIKEEELKVQQEAYFGTSGDLFMLKKQLVQPIQDQVFNAIQEISKAKKYDIIFDKSNDDVVMLYTNPKFDVSELVLQKIVKGRKKKENEKKKTDNQIAREKKKAVIKTKAEERKTKQEQLRERIKKQNEAKAAKREALKKAAAERRAKKISDAQARREALKNKGKKINTDVTPNKKETQKVVEKKDVVKKELTNGVKNKVEDEKVENIIDKKPPVKTKAQIREEKRKVLADRLKAKQVKKDSLKKVAAEKHAKKLAEIEERKRKLKEKKQNNN